ncbi:MAG: FKBP-type peptidyl-prolyl cis-trans isomerase [Bacteroidales bacterium]|nr:FKBP-type peptidyl-prolyl cis-trans isomerase [Porphyromonas sp.]MDD6935208.1 FKBP-type peptidyl-prolyl cis-trans isomerase [Bacteroidales bacterium]MDY3102437.1 FKBP-type peptidyl-prolyl cis-trans isomerase [Porphyromonas sp.]
MKDKVSYALGLSMANNFRSTGIHAISMEDFAEAMNSVFEGKDPLMTYEEAQKVLNDFFQRIQNEKKDLNLKAGKEFQEINKKKAGVTTLPNGLQYEILEKGDGPTPQKTDTVEVHYEGTLIDGTVFDSSVRRGEPASFPVTAVIAGWTEILQMMPVGSKWRVVIPSELAYGERGAGQMIEPNMTLIFMIQLLRIEDKQ